MLLHLRFVDPCGVDRDGELRYPWSPDADLLQEYLSRNLAFAAQSNADLAAEALGIGRVQVRMLFEGSARFENEAIRQEAYRRLMQAFIYNGEEIPGTLQPWRPYGP